MDQEGGYVLPSIAETLLDFDNTLERIRKHLYLMPIEPDQVALFWGENKFIKEHNLRNKRNTLTHRVNAARDI